MLKILCRHSNDAYTWYINCMQELQLGLWSMHVCIHTDDCMNKEKYLQMFFSTCEQQVQVNNMTQYDTIWYILLQII